jgi:ribosome-associated protein
LELNGQELAENLAKAALERKANDIVILDLRGLSAVTDYFIICSGTSDTHVEGIADIIEEKLEELDTKMWHREGGKSSTWILLDYIDAIVHIFTEGAREFYGLERLWGDAPKSMISDEDE